MKVICSVINWSQDVLTELNLRSIILEVDQAIYTKILDVIRFKDSGIIFSFIFLFIYLFNYCMYLTLLHCYYMHLFVGFKLSSKCFCFFKIL